MTNNNAPLLDRGVILNGKWEILEHIASGGMAEVYRARQINLDREVAVKVLSQKFLDSFEGDEEEIEAARARFQREVKAMAQIRHPNVLQVHDYEGTTVETDHGLIPIEYIIMEYVSGPNLRSTMPPEGLRENEKKARSWINRYFLPVLDGVETVHQRSIVHRDLKPENVLLDGNTPKITDFGLAGGPQWTNITRSHHMLGTMAYMAPEQLMELGDTDQRADIYSLGKILYEAICGKLTKETGFPLKTARIPDAGSPFLKRLDRLIQRATAENRHERIPSVEAFREELMEALEEQEAPKEIAPLKATRPWWSNKWPIPLAIIATVAVYLVIHYLIAGWGTMPSPGPSGTIKGGGAQGSPPSGGTLSKVSPGEGTSGARTVVRARDGAILRLIPGGRVVIPEGLGELSGKSISVPPFYMDSAEVTNHQFVEFLNMVRPRITVEGRLVKAGKEIWLHLGEVFQGYEPIIYSEGRFQIQNPEYASYPVVRVTGYGASAYARFFGRKLPTVAQWLKATEGGSGESTGGSGRSTAQQWESWRQEETERENEMLKMHEQMMGRQEQGPPSDSTTARIAPVSDLPANAFGIRGLKGGVYEWAVTSRGTTGSKENPSRFVVFMPRENAAGPNAVSRYFPLPRYPWESFEEVGFRTILALGDLRAR